MMFWKMLVLFVKILAVFSREIMNLLFEYFLFCLIVRVVFYYPQFIIADAIGINAFPLYLEMGFGEFLVNAGLLWGFWALLIITMIDEKSVFSFFVSKIPSLVLLLLNFISLSILFLTNNFDWNLIVKTYSFVPYLNAGSILVFFIAFIVSLRQSKRRGDGQDSLNILDQIFHVNIDVAYDMARNQNKVADESESVDFTN